MYKHAGFDAGSVYWEAVKVSERIGHLYDYLKILSPDEITRAQKFHFERDRNRYIVAHGILRILLAGITQIKPSMIQFTVKGKGKPVISNTGYLDFDFNMSHSGDYILYAFSIANNVGIDVEFIDQKVDSKSLVDSFFSPKEKSFFEFVSDAEKLPVFYQYWTKKEAFIKAIGHGLYFPLDGFSVQTTTEVPCPIEIYLEAHELGNWWIYPIELNAAYTAALVTNNQNNRIIGSYFSKLFA